MGAAVALHRELQGKTLIAQTKIGPIPAGTTVYCFHDAGNWFHVITPRPFLGVFEFKLAPEHREAFHGA